MLIETSLRRALVFGSTIAAFFAVVGTANALTLGFNDYDLSKSSGMTRGAVDETALNAGLANSQIAGASLHRFTLAWSEVAPGKVGPPSAAAANDPNWAGYKWQGVDRMIKAIVANGMEPVPCVFHAPPWAEGPNRPSVGPGSPAGTWRPSASAFERFAVAVARRYSGTFPDPSAPGAFLPKVKTFQAWNEPNLWVSLTPQWTKSGSRYSTTSPGLYRALANAFYRGVKGVRPDATIIGGGTAPFGGLDLGDPRIPPARFYRDLFCATTSRGKVTIRKGCPILRVDGWAHHTYPIGPPTRHARNRDDVVVNDLSKLKVLVNAAVRAKLMTAKAADNLWMTEMSWDSKPDPDGLSLEDQALYMQGAFYVLWKSGVKTIVWWNSRDDAKGADWASSLQSGIYFRGATPAQDTRKPSWTAFRFPFAAYRTKGVAALWVRAPGAGSVTVEAQNATGTWTPVTTLAARGGQVFTGRLRTGPGTQLRAVQGAETSLPWKTF